MGKIKMVPVLYLDFDGTVRKGFDELGKFVNSKEDVQVFEGVPEIIKSFKEKGYRVVGITNQGGISLGHLTEKNATENLKETHLQCEKQFDCILICPHHPDAKEKENSLCWCRKPRIGNIVSAAIMLNKRYPDECYPPHLALFVGDRPEDQQCAANAGIKFEWAKHWRRKMHV